MKEIVVRELLKDVLNQEFETTIEARADALEEQDIETVTSYSRCPSLAGKLYFLNSKMDYPNPDTGKVIEKLIDLIEDTVTEATVDESLPGIIEILAETISTRLDVHDIMGEEFDKYHVAWHYPQVGHNDKVRTTYRIYAYINLYHDHNYTWLDICNMYDNMGCVERVASYLANKVKNFDRSKFMEAVCI